MKSNINILEFRPTRVLKALRAKTVVSVYHKGKLVGTIVPATPMKEHPFVGMLKKDKRSVQQIMRELRRPRYYWAKNAVQRATPVKPLR